MKFSASEENYIKSIYRLQGKTEKVNTNSLAGYLNMRAASVTDMLKRLKTKKLLEYKKYYGFRLNETGNKEALKIIRRHRLWEFFLVTRLGMEWDKVHDIAEELEHVSSSELIKRLEKLLDMLNHYGISIGSQIKVLKAFGFDGSLQIKISKQPACIISGQAAQNIF